MEIVGALTIYFAPTIVALSRGHLSAGAIFILNLLLGWTVLGWVVALVWAGTGNTLSIQRKIHGQSSQPTFGELVSTLCAARRERLARRAEVLSHEAIKRTEARWIEEVVLPRYREKFRVGQPEDTGTADRT
jgi:uncharacterized membrane protein YqaE (UPF0057 family)